MNYQKHFKPEDVETAQAEVKCIEDLLSLAILNIRSGKFDQANRRVVDILNSIKRLESLNIKKQSDEEFRSEVSKLLKDSVVDRNLRVLFQ